MRWKVGTLEDKAITDGYYFKDVQGVTQGPLNEDEFTRAQIKGKVRPGRKAWRQKNGAIFHVRVCRHFVVGRICSCAAAGYAIELVMISTSLFMIIWIFTQPKMNEELAHGSIRENLFLTVLCIMTVAMTLLSVRTTMLRLADASSTVVSAELPV